MYIKETSFIHRGVHVTLGLRKDILTNRFNLDLRSDSHTHEDSSPN
jgi:hypothetical protein